jgi:hypothetical protein
MVTLDQTVPGAGQNGEEERTKDVEEMKEEEKRRRMGTNLPVR